MIDKGLTMKPTKYLSIVFSLLLICSFVQGQNSADLRLVQVNKKNNLECFDIELKSPHGKNINLGGQNYRLFYDASRLTFQHDQLQSYLSKEAYTDIDVLETDQNQIGFLSLSLDSKEFNQGITVLPRSGAWQKAMNICFDHIAKDNFELIWADQDKTSHFATASIALSEWVTSDRQQVLLPNILQGFNSQQVQNDLAQDIEIIVYPNPVLDYVNVDLFGNSGLNKLIIKDVIGREVVFDQVGGKSNLLYDLTNWPDGIYTVELLNEEGDLVYSNNLVKANR